MSADRIKVRISVVTVGVLLAAALVAALTWHRPPQSYVLEFPTAKSLYVGNAVQVLGVKVGKVTAIDTRPDRVRVTVKVDGDQKIPADAKAAIVSPSLVPVRNVSIFPAYRGGPALSDGDVIGLSRTAVPAEWDDVKTQLVRLQTALGPKGANREGALGHLVDASAANLDHEGTNINRTIADMSEAMATLSDNRGEIFATVRNLQVFVAALADSDHQVDLFNRRLADVADVLAANRGDLAQVLKDLAQTFQVLRSFVLDNRHSTHRALKGVSHTLRLLARNRQNIADILQAAPTTLSNFYNIYDPDVPALTGVLAPSNFDSPAQFICSTLYSFGGTPEACEQALLPIAKFFKVGSPPVGIQPYTRNGTKRIDNSTRTASTTSSEGVVPSVSSLVGSATQPVLGSGTDLLGQLMTGVQP